MPINTSGSDDPNSQTASRAGLALDPNANAVRQGRRSPLDVMNQAAAQAVAQAPAAPVGAPEAGGGTPPSIAALHAQDPDGLAQAAQKLAPMGATAFKPPMQQPTGGKVGATYAATE